jgi:hypothetical protein
VAVQIEGHLRLKTVIGINTYRPSSHKTLCHFSKWKVRFFIPPAMPVRAPSDAPIMVNVQVRPSKPHLSLPDLRPLGSKSWGNRAISLYWWTRSPWETLTVLDNNVQMNPKRKKQEKKFPLVGRICCPLSAWSRYWRWITPCLWQPAINSLTPLARQTQSNGRANFFKRIGLELSQLPSLEAPCYAQRYRCNSILLKLFP